MSWAVAVEGRADPGAVVLLLEERDEAESIAREIRERGTRVVVRPYPLLGGPARPGPVRRSAGTG